MADITTLFKATIKTLKAKEKALVNSQSEKQIDKSILKTSYKSEFSLAAKNVVSDINFIFYVTNVYFFYNLHECIFKI